MPCCDWETFSDGLISCFERQNCHSSLIDWQQAKAAWQRHHCTSGEAAAMQLQKIKREADYLAIEKINRWRGNGGNGGVNVPEAV